MLGRSHVMPRDRAHAAQRETARIEDDGLAFEREVAHLPAIAEDEQHSQHGEHGVDAEHPEHDAEADLRSPEQHERDDDHGSQREQAHQASQDQEEPPRHA